MMNPQYTLSEIEKDALQEIMNIGFGRAAADLSEIINMHIVLSVPYIAVMQSDEVLIYINHQIPDTTDMNMITQFFSGSFSGGSFLVFPDGEGRKLLRIFDTENSFADEKHDLDIIARESLVEIGNIIIGACVGKIAEMLGDVVTFAPPRFFSQEQIESTMKDILNNNDSFAILFKTVFNFEQHNVSGYLFLISQHSIMPWMKKAISEFLEKFLEAANE